MNDLRFAFRQLVKNPGFTAVAVLTLALGIGANTAIFSLIHAALLRALPFPDSDRLAVIWADNPGRKLGLPVLPPANADVAEWRERNESFANIAAFHPRTADLADGGDPERVGAAGVTAGFFETLGVTPLLGRTLARDEEAHGASPVALISHGLWQRRFGGDPALLGKSISINGGKCAIIGILPPHFDFPRGAEWPAFFEKNPLALVSAVRGEVKTLDASLPAAKMRTMQQVLSNATGARRFHMALLAFFAVAALLLTMMGIYGVVAFLVGRRSREIGIRMALGAQRRDVLRLVLQQGMKPVIFGSIAGLAGSLAASRLIASQLYGISSTDPLTLTSIIALLAAAALLACWLPARRAARVEPMVALRNE